MALSIFILAPLAAWFVAQALKYSIRSITSRRLGKFSLLFRSGGMPSAHSAGVVALVSVIGLREGIDSAVFGVALLFAAVVIYDALMVRRSVGEQGDALLLVLKKAKVARHPFVAHGHTLLEVSAGVVIGLMVGTIAAVAY